MPAGYNAVVDIYRMHDIIDEVGGASMTGTLMYVGVSARLEEASPQMELLAQGMESRRLITTPLPGYVYVLERDEAVVSGPSDHPFYSGTFRVVNVTQDSIGPGDSRRHVWVVMEKVTHSRRSV